jgi:hypothetical protein
VFDQIRMPTSTTSTWPDPGTPDGADPPRLDTVAGSREDVRRLVHRQLGAALTTLPRMWRPGGERSPAGFSFTLRGDARASSPAQLTAEGTSARYGAIVALGACHLDVAGQRKVLAGQAPSAYVDELIGALTPASNPGDVAVTAWAAAATGAADLPRSLELLRAAVGRTGYIVEIAWALSAFTAALEQADAGRQRDRLLAAFSRSGQLFPHAVDVAKLPWYRRFLGCFADQVYPIQALARFHATFGDSDGLEAAERCARQICYLQGGAGQWWWHYDWRTGAVAEEYPVYAVHQNAMAPMALLDLAAAGGTLHDEPIRAGLRWLAFAPEIGGSLIDDRLGVTWRKVARRDSGKAVRGVRGAAIGLHRRARLGVLDMVFAPRGIDYETRPYELGWLLDAWMSR